MSSRHHYMSRCALVGATLISLLTLSACSDDTVNQNNPSGPTCLPGERLNPITGQCDPLRPGNNNNSPDLNNNTSDLGGDMVADLDMSMTPDLNFPDLMDVDVPPDISCQMGTDSDSDGLDNACECRLGTDPGKPDTDGDGLPDGFEDRDKNCAISAGETLATRADTDNDGITDGEEVRLGLNPLSADTDGDTIQDKVEQDSCTDPLKEDSDGDGIPDGEEDLNQDGQLGLCVNRAYDAMCARGEYDPCKPDTDGDGEPDGEEVNFLGCRQEFLNAIPNPQLVASMPGDYQLALPTAAAAAPIMGLTSAHGHAFTHVAGSYAGFVAALPQPSNINTPERLRDEVLRRVKTVYAGATPATGGRRTVTHDGFQSVVNYKIKLGAPGQPHVARDLLINAITGQPGLTHSAAGAINASINDMFLVVGIVDRGAGRYIVTAAVASEALYNSATLDTGYLMDDVVSSMGMAQAADMLVNDCVSYKVDDRPKVDFIWVVDGSGSMTEENALVRQYAQDFARVLNTSNLDWRLGVVSSNCEDIAADVAIPSDVKALFPGMGLTGTCPRLPIGGNRKKNGQLCDLGGANFTTDVAKFQACIDQAARQSLTSEHTGTIGTAAIARAQPPSDTDNTKVRPGASVVVISVTDEFDDLISGQMGWRDAGGSGAAPNDPTLDPNFNLATLDQKVQPFVDYYLRPEINATVFGIFWIPGQPCTISSEAAADIQRIVDLTGGTYGNICSGNLQSTLLEIAESAAGIASGLRVRGNPAPPSLGVRVGDVSSQQILTPARSRQDGWDYDAVTNAVTFIGPTPPQTNDRVVITYKRWENSVQGCMVDADCPRTQKLRCIDRECR
jgi:hypothetical protein